MATIVRLRDAQRYAARADWLAAEQDLVRAVDREARSAAQRDESLAGWRALLDARRATMQLANARLEASAEARAAWARERAQRREQSDMADAADRFLHGRHS